MGPLLRNPVDGTRRGLGEIDVAFIDHHGRHEKELAGQRRARSSEYRISHDVGDRVRDPPGSPEDVTIIDGKRCPEGDVTIGSLSASTGLVGHVQELKPGTAAPGDILGADAKITIDRCFRRRKNFGAAARLQNSEKVSIAPVDVPIVGGEHEGRSAREGRCDSARRLRDSHDGAIVVDPIDGIQINGNGPRLDCRAH